MYCILGTLFTSHAFNSAPPAAMLGGCVTFSYCVLTPRREQWSMYRYCTSPVSNISTDVWDLCSPHNPHNTLLAWCSCLPMRKDRIDMRLVAVEVTLPAVTCTAWNTGEYCYILPGNISSFAPSFLFLLNHKLNKLHSYCFGLNLKETIFLVSR